MQPIVPIEAQRKSSHSDRKAVGSKRYGDKLAFVIAMFIGLGALTLSAYFFYGFFDTDKGLLTLLSSFAICFGVGASAFVPAFIIAKIARVSMRAEARLAHYALAAALLLPWIIVGFIAALGKTALPPLYGTITVSLCGALLIWAIIRAVTLRKTLN